MTYVGTFTIVGPTTTLVLQDPATQVVPSIHLCPQEPQLDEFGHGINAAALAAVRGQRLAYLPAGAAVRGARGEVHAGATAGRSPMTRQAFVAVNVRCQTRSRSRGCRRGCGHRLPWSLSQRRAPLWLLSAHSCRSMHCRSYRPGTYCRRCRSLRRWTRAHSSTRPGRGSSRRGSRFRIVPARPAGAATHALFSTV